ncbi:MAG: tetratricopeptide repeat protein [Terracidiphilus sp.]|jgi:hypothetical protein
MRRITFVALLMTGCLTAAPLLLAQTPDAGGADQKPAPGAAAAQSSSNPFPEDTTAVPVMPTKTPPALTENGYNGVDRPAIPLSGQDLDPVRSPDDPAPDEATGADADSSSSLKGLESLLPKPEDDQQNGKRNMAVKEPTHQEAASKDVEVGNYYLDTKNWKGALSRFESALVLDPENPDVYWGLAEADRHLGNLADARANYEKVAEYDPDSRHGKEARKALKEPEIANGKNAVPAQPAAETAK